MSGAATVHLTAEDEYATSRSRVKQHRYKVIPIPFVIADLEGSVSGVKEIDARDILFLSRIHPKKALDVLIRAFDQCVRCDPTTMTGVRLVVAGSGDDGYISSMKAIASDLERDGRVVWMGFVEGERKSKVLRQSTIFCLPSYQENFGVAVVEAMAAGLPVIISDQVAVSKDVIDYDAGIIIPAGDINRLSAAIIKMIQDPERLKICSSHARQLVVEKYGEAVVRSALMNLYQSVSGKTG